MEDKSWSLMRPSRVESEHRSSYTVDPKDLRPSITFNINSQSIEQSGVADQTLRQSSTKG